VKHLNNFDVVVVGGGHAGVEAANITANLKQKVCMVSMDRGAVGRMSCNPAIGGVAKGQLVRELDVLSGLMSGAADASALQYKMLNTSKGRSVWSPRAQIDKRVYEKQISNTVLSNKNITFLKGEVVSLTIKNNAVRGVVLRSGEKIKTKTVVLTCGTFLSGLIHIGERKISAGRMGESNSEGITSFLSSIGLKTMRLKTGTPPRLLKSSIDWTQTKTDLGDKNPTPFSHFTNNFFPKNTPCHIVRTNKNCHEIINKNILRSPMYTGEILGVGPRYCPSIEDKIDRFSYQKSHMLYLEPEWENSDQIYLNGYSTSLPESVQLSSLKKIKAFEKVEFLRPGYAIEYDCFSPAQLKSTLESKDVSGLFFAGQINGTSGYEEAATQGLMAGINVVSHIKNKDPLVLSRSDGYIGVLIDDLITKDTEEPYRMFTSRAEHRLVLRYSNADERLLEKSKKHGLLSQEKIDVLLSKIKTKQNILKTAQKSISSDTVKNLNLKQKIKIEKYVKRPSVELRLVLEKEGLLTGPGNKPDWLYLEALFEAETEIKYEGYIKRHLTQLKNELKNESQPIALRFNYNDIVGLSTEAKEKLCLVRPQTLGQASRVSGVRSSDISVLMINLLRK
tara:strand:- start:1803 stop:3659 length:1857 start_codon:yes stop_codon:yes gene_type:complete